MKALNNLLLAGFTLFIFGAIDPTKARQQTGADNVNTKQTARAPHNASLFDGLLAADNKDPHFAIALTKKES